MLPVPGYLTDFLIYATAGAAVSLPLLLANTWLAPRLGLMDWPKARGLTEQQVPIIGYALVLVAVGFMAALTTQYPLSPWIFTTTALMGLMGHIDDRKPLPPLDKFFFQIICALAVVFLDPGVYAAITEPFGLWGALWGVFFLLGLVNCVNFIDGIDGLAGIVLIVGAVGYIGLSGGLQQPFASMSASLAGALCVFLYFNIVRRRGFLGNIGSYALSFLLGTMHLSVPLETSGVVSKLSLSGLCFAIPIADGLTVILSRVLTSRSPFHPDRGHLHHRLLQTNVKLRWVLSCFGALAVASMGLGLVISRLAQARSSELPALVCAAHVGLVASLVVFLDRASRRRVLSYFERIDAGLSVHYVRYVLSAANGSPLTLAKRNRIEALASAEIRVSDFCYVDEAGRFCITLRTLSEPLENITARMEALLREDGIRIVRGPDLGHYSSTPLTVAPSGKIRKVS